MKGSPDPVCKEGEKGEGGRGERKRREEEEGGRGGRKRREEEERGRGERGGSVNSYNSVHYIWDSPVSLCS